MSYVTTDVYITAQQSLEVRLSMMEGKLNELFTNVDNKMNEAAHTFSVLEGQMPVIGQEMKHHRTDIPATVKTITDEARAFVTKRTDVLNKAGQTLQAEIVKTNSFV